MNCSNYYKCYEAGKLKFRSCQAGKYFYEDIKKCRPGDSSRCAEPCPEVTSAIKVPTDSSGEPDLIWPEGGLKHGMANNFFTTHSKQIPELTTKVFAGDTTSDSSNSETTLVEALPDLDSVFELTVKASTVPTAPRLNGPSSTTSRLEDLSSTTSRVDDLSPTTSRLDVLSSTISRLEDTSSSISGEEDPSLNPGPGQDNSHTTTAPTGEKTDAQKRTTTGPPVTKRKFYRNISWRLEAARSGFRRF